MKIVVVGGGIAGLASARRLEARVPAADVLVLESDSEPGGKLRTEHFDGFAIEAAADSFLSRKERGVGLCEELGLGGELIGRRPGYQHTFVRRADELRPLPEGLTGMIPTNLEALEASELLSDEGKARFASEPAVPVLLGHEDESIGSFVSRRFGREAYEALVEPLLTGIYGGDGDRLSLQAMFPQLRVVELEHGSVLRGLAGPGPGDRPPFVSLRDGMGALVSALCDGFVRTKLLVDSAAARISRAETGYKVELADGNTIAADGVVIATPAYVTAVLIANLDLELAIAHAEIPYASSVIVTLAFLRADVDPLDGYGYLVPRAEGGDVLACTWSSQKWEGRSPDDGVLVRVYAGRFGGRELMRDSDEALIALARDEIAFLGVDADPLLSRVHRWPHGMPQYVLGHPDRLARIDAALAGHCGLALAGAAYRGVGIPDCIRSGEEAAESVARALVRTRA